MAAHRIRVTGTNHVLPRCKSEGTLIDLSETISEASLTDVKGQHSIKFLYPNLKIFSYCFVRYNNWLKNDISDCCFDFSLTLQCLLPVP